MASPFGSKKAWQEYYNQSVMCGCGNCTYRNVVRNTGCWDPWIPFLAMWINLAYAIEWGYRSEENTEIE